MFATVITDDTPHKGITTLYPLYIDSVTGDEIFIRCLLTGTFWNDSTSSNYLRNGILTANAVQLFIPIDPKATGKAHIHPDAIGRIYVSPAEWSQLSYEEARDKYWTIDPRQQRDVPIMVKGAREHEFQFHSPTASAGTQPPNLALQRQAFLKSEPRARTARVIDEQFFGSNKSKWHVMVTM